MSRILPLRAFADNYIWVIASAEETPTDGRICAVIDPGDAGTVLDFCDQEECVVGAILVTHHHSDHIGGIAQLTERFDVPVYGPANENIPHLSQALREGDEISLPDGLGSLRVLDVPGHTAGHIAFHNQKALFCGDTLFGAGCGRLFEGTAPQLYESLNKLAALPKELDVYCAHEYTLANLRFARQVEPSNPAVSQRLAATEIMRDLGKPSLPSTIALELATNPFLRCTEPQVRASAEGHAGRELPGPVDVFAALRSWKNQF